MKNIQLRPRTVADIDAQVQKVLRGLGSPEPPIDLRLARELLRLDREYYSSSDGGLLHQVVSRLKVAGAQVLKRPTILGDAIRKLSLKALYLPDEKRILLDEDLPPLKHRWNEAHEIGHDIIPWHAGMMLGDTEQTLTPACHEQMEAEANYAAGRLLFLGPRFRADALSTTPSLEVVRQLKKAYGNTLTSTLWRFVEHAHVAVPMVGVISGHPHPSRRAEDFDPANPCRYVIESGAFAERFGRVTAVQLFRHIVGYCGPQRGGGIGTSEVVLADSNGSDHVFHFETFFNRYEALTLGVYRHPSKRIF